MNPTTKQSPLTRGLVMPSQRRAFYTPALSALICGIATASGVAFLFAAESEQEPSQAPAIIYEAKESDRNNSLARPLRTGNEASVDITRSSFSRMILNVQIAAAQGASAGNVTAAPTAPSNQ